MLHRIMNQGQHSTSALDRQLKALLGVVWRAEQSAGEFPEMSLNSEILENAKGM